MFQIGSFTLRYNLTYSDWCLENSVLVRVVRACFWGQLVSAPADKGHLLLASEGSSGAGFKVINEGEKCKCSLLNVNNQWVSA